MKLTLTFGVMACTALVIAGCSHGATTVPTAPTTPPAVTIKRLIVTPTGGMTMVPGGTMTITSSGAMPPTGALGAYAEFTDNSFRFVEAEWTSSDPAVLMVTNTAIRALARGTVTLTAATAGHTASETFTVNPGIAGTWAGDFLVDRCTAGSGAIDQLICSGVPGREPGQWPVGASRPISFVITQAGTALTATAAFGAMRGTLTGTDRGANLLTLSGDLGADRTTIKLTHWDSQVTIDSMAGFVNFEVRVDGVPSYGIVSGRLANVTRR
jgi:hypothetical protein